MAPATVTALVRRATALPVSAVAAANRATLPDGMPLVILSTAHPAKFPEAVQAATGAAPPTPASARRLDGKAERFDRLPADAETIKTYIRDFARW
jgi:threonine synthase